MSDRRGRVRDGLALAHALPDRSLVAMVAAMSLLAALTWAGVFGAQSLSARWAQGAENLITVQVPDPEKPATQAGTTERPPDNRQNQAGSQRPRIDAVMEALQGQPDVSTVHRLNAQELDQLLTPWLGSSGAAALPLPGVIEIHLAPGMNLTKDVSSRIAALAPGTLIERNDDWRRRLQVVARSLVACAALAIILVSGIGAAVIGMATRLGLGARRESIMILHGLGAADGYVASRFGSRVAGLSLMGGVVGTMLGVPPIVIVTQLMAPLSGPQATMEPAQDGEAIISGFFGSLMDSHVPSGLISGLVCVPIAAAVIGWLTAQIIVRVWLRRLP
ncbi:cell division protein FtsX [Acetobacter fallax]|uniref:Cell division protein FtsX n=1 Tax=Acetobacter fallax TaxID=1737473 RepID=A0ABX0KC44_9PROT|nr:cell division protein FtsX [Acetobacter fallax]NHO34009.1 cell division protein FtsX [Acetobacter fallax]NHO37543.1 cell division protein FtsX [Acetobacter fallax]